MNTGQRGRVAPSRGPKGQRGGGRLTGGGPNSRFSNPLFNPNATLSGQSLNSAAQALANSKEQDAISALAKQIATNNQSSANQQSTDFGYYMQLAQAAKQAVGQQQQIGAGLNSQLANIDSQSQQAIGQYGQQAQSGVLGRMNALGLGGDSINQLKAATAQQQGVAAQYGQTAREQGALQNANYASDANAQRGVVGLEGEQQIGDLARANTLANSRLNAQIATDQEKKSTDYQTALGQLRAAERSYTIAKAGVGLKNATLANTIATDRARIGATIRGQNVSAANTNRRTAAELAIAGARNKTQLAIAGSRNATTARDYAAGIAERWAALNEKRGNDAATQAYRDLALRLKAQGTGGAVKPLTTHEQDIFIGEIQSARSAIVAARNAGHRGIQVREALQSGSLQKGLHAIAPPFIDAAYELLGWGYITPGTAKALAGWGIQAQGKLPIKSPPGTVKPGTVSGRPGRPYLNA